MKRTIRSSGNYNSYPVPSSFFNFVSIVGKVLFFTFVLMLLILETVYNRNQYKDYPM